MQTIKRAIQILRTEGSVSFLLAVFRFVYWNLGIRTAYLTLRHKATDSQMDVTITNVTTTMAVTTYPEFERFYDLKSEKEILEDILDEIADDDVFYDIGANVGLYSCFVGSKSPEGSVYSFEPHPVNVDALKKNFQLNDVSGTIFQMALSDEEGTFELSSEGSKAGLGEHSLDTTQSESTVPVTVRQLDSLRTEHDIPVPTIIKIDVEGAELNVIKGATETLSKPNCKTIYCEIHPTRIKAFGGSSEELRDYLLGLGFEIENLDREMGERVMIKATK